MCKKIKHVTTYHAHQHILALKKDKKLKKRKKMGIYFCNECEAYHITMRIKRAPIVTA